MNEHTIFVENIQKDMDVDNLVPGGTNLVEVENLKQNHMDYFPKEDLIYINGTQKYPPSCKISAIF